MMLLGHVVLAFLGVGGGGLHISRVTPSNTGDLLILGFLLGVAPGLLFGVLLGRIPDPKGGRGNRGWWRFWHPHPRRPGPLPTGGGSAPPSGPADGEPDSVPDHVPGEWTERYLPAPSTRASTRLD